MVDNVNFLLDMGQGRSQAMISPNKSFTMHTPYTYIHVTDLTFGGRIFKHTKLEMMEEGTPKQYTFPSIGYCVTIQ